MGKKKGKGNNRDMNLTNPIARHADPANTYSYDLYNTATEQTEATERLTSDEARRRNHRLLVTGEPQRWVATRWVNH